MVEWATLLCALLIAVGSICLFATQSELHLKLLDHWDLYHRRAEADDGPPFQTLIELYNHNDDLFELWVEAKQAQGYDE